MIKDKNYLVTEAKAKDKFGDYGTIALSITNIDKNKKKAIIKNFLFSCRAIGRMMEEYFLQNLFNNLRKKKLEIVEIEFFHTKKNIVVYSFLKKQNYTNITKTKNKTVFTFNINKLDIFKDHKNLIKCKLKK